MVRQFDDALSNTTVLVRGIIPGAMRTAFRAKIYHAENPADQPAPGIVAGKIAAMLRDDISTHDLIVDLS
jgi:hypothetical protein